MSDKFLSLLALLGIVALFGLLIFAVVDTVQMGLAIRG